MTSITPNSDDESKNCAYAHNESEQLPFWEFLRTRKKQGIIFRAVGNLTLNDVELYVLTLSSQEKRLSPNEKYELIRQKVGKLQRAWVYRHDITHYCIVISGGETGNNPHCHIITTSPLPDNWNESEIDSHESVLGSVDNIETEVKKISRYAEKNLRQELPFKARSFRKSSEFYDWANPAIFHLYRKIGTPVSVYVHNSTKNSFNVPLIPELKPCVHCQEKLPNTRHYFNYDDMQKGRLRTECHRCYSIKRRVCSMNAQAKRNGFSGTVLFEDAYQLVMSNMVGLQYRDFWDGQLIDSYEFDHIVCRARGGRHAIGNLCITSASNNRAKSDKSVKTWLTELYVNRGIVHPMSHHRIDIASLPRQKRMFAS